MPFYHLPFRFLIRNFLINGNSLAINSTVLIALNVPFVNPVWEVDMKQLQSELKINECISNTREYLFRNFDFFLVCNNRLVEHHGN